MRAKLLNFTDDPQWGLIPKRLIGKVLEVEKISYESRFQYTVTSNGKYGRFQWLLKSNWLDFDYLKKIPTIHQIKKITDSNNQNPYFSPEMLKFYGQELSDFTVKKSPKGRIFIYAPSYWKIGKLPLSEGDDVRFMGFSFMEFTGESLIKPEDSPLRTNDFIESKDAIDKYIKNH